MKTIKIIAILSLYCCSVFAQNFTQNLQIYMPFNGNANDEVANYFDGAVYGASLTTDRFNNPNSAYHFDGIDNYIEIGYQAMLDHPDSFTVSLWAIGEGGYTETHVIFDFGYGRDRGIGIHYTDVNKQVGGFAYNETLLQNVPTLNSEWHHYLLTYNSDTLYYYIDGALMEKRSVSVGTIDNYNMRLGAQSKSLARYWHGKIDDFRYYDRGFSSEEVNLLYTEEKLNTLTIIDNETNSNAIRFYPNPAQNHIYFSAATQFEIYDASGKLVLSGNENHLNLQALSNGFYIVKTLSNNSSASEKLIINH